MTSVSEAMFAGEATYCASALSGTVPEVKSAVEQAPSAAAAIARTKPARGLERRGTLMLPLSPDRRHSTARTGIVQPRGDGMKARGRPETTTRAGRRRPAAENRAKSAAARRAGARNDLGLHRQQAFTLQLLAGELAGPADRFRPLAGFLFGGLFVMAAKLHLAENALALHLFLERLEGLVDVIVANEHLHAVYPLHPVAIAECTGRLHRAREPG